MMLSNTVSIVIWHKLVLTLLVSSSCYCVVKLYHLAMELRIVFKNKSGDRAVGRFPLGLFGVYDECCLI